MLMVFHSRLQKIALCSVVYKRAYCNYMKVQVLTHARTHAHEHMQTNTLILASHLSVHVNIFTPALIYTCSHKFKYGIFYMFKFKLFRFAQLTRCSFWMGTFYHTFSLFKQDLSVVCVGDANYLRILGFAV